MDSLPEINPDAGKKLQLDDIRYSIFDIRYSIFDIGGEISIEQ